MLKTTRRQPRTQGLSLGKTLASAGHVTLIKICSRGRVGECRIYNYFTTPCCRIRSRVPFVLTFAKLNSLHRSDVILKPKQVIFLRKDLPC